jgi:23S rRNA-intervening sequence protein
LLSIYSNFGEGFERDGNREFAQSVSIAKGSTGEARAQLMYALDFGYLTPETFSSLDEHGKKAAECLGGLIRYLNQTSYRGRKFKREDEFQTKRPSGRRQNRPRITPGGTPDPASGDRRTLKPER